MAPARVNWGAVELSLMNAAYHFDPAAVEVFEEVDWSNATRLHSGYVRAHHRLAYEVVISGFSITLVETSKIKIETIVGILWIVSMGVF